MKVIGRLNEGSRGFGTTKRKLTQAKKVQHRDGDPAQRWRFAKKCYRVEKEAREAMMWQKKLTTEEIIKNKKKGRMLILVNKERGSIRTFCDDAGPVRRHGQQN